jgi:tRNA(Ile)-lysidine synthase
MKLDVPTGKYVLAVSGGVDSMVLLDLLNRQNGVELIIAHFNHGIRKDSGKDQELVRKIAKKHSLPIEIGHGVLGPSASEEKARNARYEFLKTVQKKYGAHKIVTAHHQDDLIETAILNILRGTGRRGLSSMANNPDILRPMLRITKEEILKYANQHNLLWNEDATNQDTEYLRNYVRLKLIPKLTDQQKQLFLQKIDTASESNIVINQEIEILSQNIAKNNKIDRSFFTSLPVDMADEVMMQLLRSNGLGEFDRKSIQRLTIATRTSKAGSRIDVNGGAYLELTGSKAHLNVSEKA